MIGASGCSAERASLEKAIDIKRRAQRCFQNGDLDGALLEYEKLTRAEDSEPINLVVMADLLYKKEDLAEASRRYLQAVDSYTSAGLYKNAIAVCKKMTRLSLSLADVLKRLAELHALDGLNTEAALYYQGYAEHLAREQDLRGAAASLRKAFDAAPEDPRLLEKAADWLVEVEEAAAAAALLAEASGHFARRGLADDAARTRERAEQLAPGSNGNAPEAMAEPEAEPPAAESPPVAAAQRVAPAEAPEPPAREVVEGLEARPTFVAPVPAATPTAEDDASDVTPPAPSGLRFGAHVEPSPGRDADAAPATAAISAMPEVSDIEELLSLAAERFKLGQEEQAAAALVEAARAYEALDRMESAAAIYRSLGRSAHSTREVMSLWLRNCEQRGEPREAAEVACGLGDLALSDGDLEAAGGWFEHALRHVPNHELATRRMQRLGARPDAPAPAAPKGAGGRVEVAVGRAQAVSFDLGSLIDEFRNGIAAQISGDPQSHYDLGMTYREMGLTEQAVDCFRTAAQAPDFLPRCAEMIGRCLLDEGRFDEAAEEFARALAQLGDASEAGVGLRFQLGLAHEVAGHAAEALAEFERVYAARPNYPDVAQKIGALRRALERV